MAGDTPGRAPLPPLNIRALAEALLPNADMLVNLWLPGGKVSNGEYLVDSYWRSEKTPSLSVRLTGENAGRWADFGGDHRGNDLVSLYAAINNMDNGHAAVELARQYGLESVANVQGKPAASALPRPAPVKLPPAAKPKAEQEGWTPITPVPDYAQEPDHKHFYRDYPPQHVARYERDGALYGFVVRFIKSDGKKATLPYVFCSSKKDGGSKWVWRGWNEPRPLYLPGGLSPGQRTVVLVEGELKAEVLQRLLDAGAPGVYVVVSWVGGCKAWKKADWAWLAGCTVLLWPDCDGKRVDLTRAEEAACPDAVALEAERAAKPLLPVDKQGGMAAMLGIGALLRDAHTCTVQLLPIPAPGAVADGWDCRDAIEVDGWDFAKVLALFGQAYALPAGGVSVEPVAAKKIVSLVSTEGAVGSGDAGAAGGDGEWIGGKEVPMWLLPFYNERRAQWNLSRELVIAALRNDPGLKDVLARNELTLSLEARTAWPGGPVGVIGKQAGLLLGDYFTRTYGLGSMHRSHLDEAITTVAYANAFHPIREELKAAVWDGKPRMDKWLIFALRESPESLAPAMLEYLQIVGRGWLLGMVNRVMKPGCKFDYCPVLEGKGGLRKSTMVEVLCGSSYYTDTKFQVDKGNEAFEKIKGIWLCEMSELEALSKSSITAIKAFISSKVDRFRAAYAADVEAHPRQCVLVGTTNDNKYLRDPTGNRRFWPVPVRHTINTEWLEKYRTQLLAEAYALYLEGAAFTPTEDEERRLFAPMQASRMMETPVESELLALLTRSPTGSELGTAVNELTEFVTSATLIKALGTDVAKATSTLVLEVNRWMRGQGWEEKKRTICGARVLGFVRPPRWPSLDAEDEMVAAVPASGQVADLTEDADDVPF